MSKKRSLLETGEESGKRICSDYQQLLLDDMFFPALPDVADDVDGEMETETQHTNNSADGQRNNDIPCGQHSETITRLRSTLTSTVDIQHGLLDELRALDVITHPQFDEIRSQRTVSGRVNHLLNIVVQMPDAQQEQFLTALQNTQQIHVSELIRGKVNANTLNRDMWPVRCCMEWRTVIKNWKKLVELIDLKCGLLEELLSEGCITHRQMQTIKAGKTDTDQNAMLLSVLSRRRLQDLRILFECLIATRQSTVARLVSENYRCGDEPLSDEKKSLLDRHYSKLVNLIDSGCGLLAEMITAECISLRQKQFIESGTSSADCNSRLLDILRRGSESDFNKFILCLLKTGQKHVASIIQEVGHVLCVDAGTNCSASKENCIVKRIMDVISASASSCSDTQWMNVCAELESRGVHLIGAVKQNSIGLFYLCHSFTSLQHLYDLLSSGELKQFLEHFFSVLLNGEESVVVHSLHWDIRDLMNGLQYLHSKANLKIFSELYKVAMRSRLESSTSSVCSLNIDKLPSELLLLILSKTMGQLFVIVHRVTPRAAVDAMATLGGVSTLWWRTITYRQYDKRVLKRYFQCVCSPFKCNPRRLPSLLLEKNVSCLTEFNGQLYVGVAGSASVQVFVSRPPFRRLDDITVQGLNDPSDIAVCRDTKQLYIADRGSQYAIWRVNLLCNKQADKFITIQWQPHSLSVNSRRLLITPYDGNALFLYSDDGSLFNHIKLPDYMNARHAVETTHSTYIVSHYNRYHGDTQSEHNSVSEVNVDGQVVRTFNSQHIDIDSIQFNWPYYLALYDNNHVIVADGLNERVVVLKSDLTLKRVLMTSLGQLPSRLCLSKSTGIMFIKYYRSSVIDIYKVVT